MLSAASKNANDDEAKELRRTSELYVKLGRALSQGTAPATKSVDAYDYLVQASNYDRSLGNAFNDDISTKLAQVAPKAAASYIAAKNFQSARNAILTAERYGSGDSGDVKLVRQKLESVASAIYADASKEITSNPTAAKEKLKQIKQMVDTKSPWYIKAQKLLQGG